MKKYTLGAVVTLDGAFRARNEAGEFVLSDPTTLKLILGRPGGTYHEGVLAGDLAPTIHSIEKTGTGTYYADVKPDVAGVWTWRWEPTGEVEGAFEGMFSVESAQDQPLDILIEPEDYDAVRNVLGVTALDVKDADVESLTFGRQAEARLKAEFPEWSGLLAVADTQVALRTMAVYMTAALIAESMAKGGFLGLVGDRNRRWDAEAEGLWAKVSEWRVIITDPTGQLGMYDLPMVSLANARKVRQRQWQEAPSWANGFPATWGGWSRK